MKLVGALLFTALCPLVVMAQGEIFSDGFETGDTSAWAETYYGGMVVTLPGGVQLALRYIPNGTFMMGSPVEERGRFDWEDLHQVTLTQGYYLGATEVTQAQWEAVMGAPMSPACGDYGVGPDHPVYCVTWAEIAGASGFVERLNLLLATTAFRLPTEAEWERAARVGTQTRFSHGDVLDCGDDCEACPEHDLNLWWCGNLTGSLHPVGSKLGNGFSLVDMHGSVWEWAQDYFEYSLGSDPQVDPAGPPTGTHHVVHSGSFDDTANSCRSAARHSIIESYSSWDLGFRIARTP